MQSSFWADILTNSLSLSVLEANKRWAFLGIKNVFSDSFLDSFSDSSSESSADFSFDSFSVNSIEEVSKEKSTDDSDDENEKKSDEKNKSEKELFAYKRPQFHSAEMMAETSVQSKIHAEDENCISSLYVFLPENPPKL